jgi:hypothetical protein
MPHREIYPRILYYINSFYLKDSGLKDKINLKFSMRQIIIGSLIRTPAFIYSVAYLIMSLDKLSRSSYTRA